MKSTSPERDDIQRAVSPRAGKFDPLDEADTLFLRCTPKLEEQPQFRTPYNICCTPKLEEQPQFRTPYNILSEDKTGALSTMETLVGLDTPGRAPNYVQNGHVEEKSLSLLTTMSMLAVLSRDEAGHQDYFINAWNEEIARHETLRLPIVETVPTQQGQAEKRQVIASTASGAAIAGIGDLISAVVRYGTTVVMTHIVTQSIYGI